MGSISDSLNNLINSKKSEANQYKADIAKYQQGVGDLEKAKKLFEESYKKMCSLIYETDGVFQGDAATQFCLKLTTYNNAVKDMPPIMERRIQAFKKRINELERQKGWCEFWTGVYTGLMSTFKFFNL